MKLLTTIMAALMLAATVQEPLPCKQAAEIRGRLGDRLDGLMYLPDTVPGKLTDSIITIRQWVEKLEKDCDSLKNNGK